MNKLYVSDFSIYLQLDPRYTRKIPDPNRHLKYELRFVPLHRIGKSAFGLGLTPREILT